MSCTFFSSRQWDDRRWEAAREWPLPFFLVEGVSLDDRERVAKALRDQLNADPITSEITVGDVWPSEEPVAGVTRTDVLSAWDAREETPDPPSRCPHDAVADSRCVFHGDADPKDVRAALHRVIESDETRERYLSGATLPSLDFRYERIDAPDRYPIRLNYADIEGLDLTNATVRQGLNLEYARIEQTAQFHNANFESHLTMRGAQIDCDVYADELTIADTFRAPDLTIRGDFHATRATFERQINLHSTNIEGTLRLSRATIQDVVNFESLSCGSVDAQGVTFEDVVSFDSFDTTNLELSGSTFAGLLQFKDTSITEFALFLETEFQDRAFFTGIEAENLMFAGATITHRLDLDDATVSEQINFGSAEVAELHAEGVEASTVTLMDATVRDGRIEIPPHDGFTCNLTRTTLGNVIFAGPHDRFESVLFSKTRFDGFNFDIDPHREALESVDWNIHEPARAVAEPGRTFEVTYARAKEGAKGMGDMIAASQFFVRQMRQRRRNHRQEIVQSDRGIIARGAAALKYVSNGSLDLTTAYGERPRRVVGLSLLTIVGFAMLYPFTTGLEVGEEIISHETAGVSAFPKSLYFSVVTFTTVGYGDIQPAGSLAQGLAGFEAFLGAFLMALLVFVFGRTIRM